jgi:hypothetical protein
MRFAGQRLTSFANTSESQACGLTLLSLHVSSSDAMIALDTLHPKRAHNAQSLAFEVVVTYPFHPWSGQTVFAVGRYDLAGIHHFIIRLPDGAPFFLPAWMTSAEAGVVSILSDPRLPVNRLLDLRALVDRLVAPSLEHVPQGGQNDEKRVRNPAGPVRAASSPDRSTNARAHEGDQTAQNAADGSNDKRGRHGRRRQAAGGQ